jgi:hypothetical protein
VFYKLSYEIVGLHNHLKGIEQIEFCPREPKGAVVYLNQKYSNGDAPVEPSSAICVGIAAQEIEDDRIASELKAAVSSSLDGSWANFGAAESGRMPILFKAVDDVFGPLGSAMKSIVSVLRWREGLPEGPADPFRRPREFLSLDGNLWREIPCVRSLAVRFGIPTKQQIAASDEVPEGNS